MLVKPAICLALGLLSTYFCAVHIVESEHFNKYMYYMLKDYDNPSAAMLGLLPEFIIFVNLVVSIAIHLFAILIYRFLNSVSISTVIRQIILVFCTLLFIGFCTMTLISLTNVYEGYFIPSLIPKIFWVGYGGILLFIYFKQPTNRSVNQEVSDAL